MVLVWAEVNEALSKKADRERKSGFMRVFVFSNIQEFLILMQVRRGSMSYFSRIIDYFQGHYVGSESDVYFIGFGC
jgi:arginine repressor